MLVDNEEDNMNERLIVKNFLCLKDVDIEVKDFLVLIGPQATGKSLCAKLLYFFRSIFVEIAIYVMKNTVVEKHDFKQILLDRFELFFPKSHWSNQVLYIEYRYNTNKCFIMEKKESQELNIDVQQALALVEDVKEILQIFIPAGRSFFSLLQKNIFKFLRTSNNIDPFLLEFGIFYEDIKQLKHGFIPAMVNKIIQSILKGVFMPDENILLLTEGNKIPLELLSSGQQEALPLMLVLSWISSSKNRQNTNGNHYSYNIYIEEPEAHLFPDAQEAMSRLISFLQHNTEWQTTFFITTHSPYMLAAFNNLIKAGNIVKQNPALKEAVCKAIPESMHIDIDRFAAYTLEDGSAVSIIDNETNLINADAIDSVSESIMEIFNTLQDIEFGDGKAGEHV
jgi:predicted ATPase